MLSDTVRKIKELKIQGAENIAIAAIKAMDKARDKNKAMQLLVAARPTEPMLRNSLKYLMDKGDASFLINEINANAEKISKFGASLIRDNSIVYTHCHSGTVVRIIAEAAKSKRIAVHNTETRPKLQGRITAKALSKLGIHVDFYVDSAAFLALENAGIMLIGADAITSTGIINKIGSRLIANAARELHVPVYSAADALKIDFNAMKSGEPIEQRSKSEVWNTNDKNITVHNPAFEEVPYSYISGIITQFGITGFKELYSKAKEAYPFIFKN